MSKPSFFHGFSLEGVLLFDRKGYPKKGNPPAKCRRAQRAHGCGGRNATCISAVAQACRHESSWRVFGEVPKTGHLARTN